MNTRSTKHEAIEYYISSNNTRYTSKMITWKRNKRRRRIQQHNERKLAQIEMITMGYGFNFYFYFLLFIFACTFISFYLGDTVDINCDTMCARELKALRANVIQRRIPFAVERYSTFVCWAVWLAICPLNEIKWNQFKSSARSFYRITEKFSAFCVVVYDFIFHEILNAMISCIWMQPTLDCVWSCLYGYWLYHSLFATLPHKEIVFAHIQSNAWCK